MSRRKMRQQAEWNVIAQTSCASGPSILDKRSFSSFAALLVNVMAIILQGSAGSSAHRKSALRRSNSRIGSASCSKNKTSSSVTVSGTRLLSLPDPNRIKFAIRLISTVVLPLPAPASNSNGPSVVKTASRCIVFKFINCVSIYLRLAVMKREIIWSVIITPIYL